MGLEHILALRCVICGRRYAVAEVDYICPRHGLEGVLDVEYDFDLIRHRMIPPGEIDESFYLSTGI